MTAGACGLYREESLLLMHGAAALASAASFTFAPWSRTTALAGVTVFWATQRDGAFGSIQDIVHVDVYGSTQTAARGSLTAATTTTTAEQAFEDAATAAAATTTEDISELLEDGSEVDVDAAATARSAGNSSVTEAVVACTFFAIRKHRVSLGGFLELV